MIAGEESPSRGLGPLLTKASPKMSGEGTPSQPQRTRCSQLYPLYHGAEACVALIPNPTNPINSSNWRPGGEGGVRKDNRSLKSPTSLPVAGE